MDGGACGRMTTLWIGRSRGDNSRHPPTSGSPTVLVSCSGTNWLTVLFPLGRLYSKGRILGHKRGKRNTRPNTTLVQVEGVSNKEEAQFYLGKVRSYVLRQLD